MDKSRNAEEYIARQRAAIAANPECGTSRYNLAVALMGQQKYDEAEKELIEAINCSPTLAEAYVQLGGICLHRGDLEGCLRYNKLSVKSRAAFAEGWGNIGFVELQKGNLEEAIRALKKAIIYNKRFIQAYTTLANAYLMSGLLEESIETNLKVLEIEPDFPIAHNNLAICYLEQGNHEKAIEHCDRAIGLGYQVNSEILKEINGHR
jgi:tetratricopeptide (TPR) repeat protein